MMINLVSFPGLGLEFLLNRVVFEVLGRPIYWYGLIIACGFMIGTMVSARLAEKSGIPEDHVYDFLFYAVPAALVGLRTYFVLFYLDLFKNADGSLNWAAIVRISDGGMAIYGGIIAGAIVMYFFTKKRKLGFFNLADVAMPGILLGQGIGRWGNFMNVEAYGGLTDIDWRMCSSSIAEEMLAKGYATTAQYEEIIAGTLGVHPTFLYESLWNFLGFFVLMFLFKHMREFTGQITLTYFAWYGFGRFIIEGMRTDSLYFFGLEFMGQPLRTSQMLSLGLCVGALILLDGGKKGKVASLKPIKTGESTSSSEIKNTAEKNISQNKPTEKAVTESSSKNHSHKKKQNKKKKGNKK